MRPRPVVVWRTVGDETVITKGLEAGEVVAVPVDEINRLVPQLIRHGKVAGPPS